MLQAHGHFRISSIPESSVSVPSTRCGIFDADFRGILFTSLINISILKFRFEG